MNRDTPLLDRNNPDKEPLGGHTKVTRDDWLNIARDILVNDGVAEVKVLKLAELLGVSRSSFYWYFTNRKDLLNALLDEWSNRNTARLVAHCQRDTKNISAALCNFFQCFVNPAIFDTRLDFAVREWARRDPGLRARIDDADDTRIAAAVAMYARHGYGAVDADARGRILYFMQLGYHALKKSEPMEERMSRMVPYMRGFLGQEPDPGAIADFFAYITDNDLR
ncbi:TetR/AcrR family transcriptional regulator [Loktanella sp. Alg231-35]|uniref:TetR/AcrR family transcriptional regulator n=1 Tax=Loktanella sp. Alg231-35 TaxID=1922220 RepID=UPI000D55780E|nr:TetR/AcrR family transcriptional regulator [Loktanella sp. Alg231-35]